MSESNVVFESQVEERRFDAPFQVGNRGNYPDYEYGRSGQYEPGTYRWVRGRFAATLQRVIRR